VLWVSWFSSTQQASRGDCWFLGIVAEAAHGLQFLLCRWQLVSVQLWGAGMADYALQQVATMRERICDCWPSRWGGSACTGGPSWHVMFPVHCYCVQHWHAFRLPAGMAFVNVPQAPVGLSVSSLTAAAGASHGIVGCKVIIHTGGSESAQPSTSALRSNSNVPIPFSRCRHCWVPG
jgi:hypothetical protein